MKKRFDFKLNEVKVTDAYIENALQKELEYLRAFDVDKLVAGFEEVAKIKPRAEKYQGWESTEIRGHSLGHYMTAVAQAIAQTGDEVLSEKLNAIVERLAHAQLKSGYLSAFPETLFDNVENKKPCWVPWYTMDKIIAGLTAAYVFAGNEQALAVVTKLGDWVYERTSRWSEETQKVVLAVEYGGMNEAMYDLYRVTGKETHAIAAHQFDEEELFREIYEGRDVLNGKHANTTIPKFLGALYRYTALGYREEDLYYLTCAKRFWEMVIGHHTYITGGNSEWEHFGEPEVLDAERTNCNCETCNTYNMLKLSRELYQITGEKKYADFYENTFVNAILSSQNPETGMTMYFQPMATGFFKVYSTPFQSFWCCTGTGMENFTKCNDSIYFRKDETVYVNQYLSSEFQDDTRGFVVKQTSEVLNGGDAIFDIIEGNGVLALRIPDWIAGEPEISGTAAAGRVEDGYYLLSVTKGERVHVVLPMEIRAHALSDNQNCIGLKYGPVVLSAALGMEDMEESKTGVDVTIATRNIALKDFITVKAADGSEESTQEDVTAWIEEIGTHVSKKEGALSFSLEDTDSDDLVFTPHYKQHKERYGIYWNMVAKDSQSLQKHILDGKKKARLEHVMTDSIPLGNDQYELLHEIAGENTGAGTFNGLMLRHAWSEQGWFSYRMKVNAKETNYLLVKYFSGNVGRTFNIYIDDVLLKEETIENRIEGEFYDEYYELPKDMVAGKDSVVVRFAVRGDSWVGGIFDRLSIVGAYKNQAGLKNLVIEGGNLEPAFSTECTEYQLTADGDELSIQAELEDSYGLLYLCDTLVDDTVARRERAIAGRELVFRAVAEDFETEKIYTVKIK